MAKKGRYEADVIFLLNGVVINVESQRYFEVGHVLNYKSVFLKCESEYTMMAHSQEVDCLIFSEADFMNVCSEFSDFKKDIIDLINQEEDFIQQLKQTKAALGDKDLMKAILDESTDATKIQRETN